MPVQFSSQAGSVLADNMPLHSTCRVFVASHETVAGDSAPGRYNLSQDVVGCEVTDAFQGNTANITLLPRRPYIHWLFPGDWISIYMSSGADAREGYGVVGMRERMGDNIRTFFGKISAIRENVQVASPTGQTTVRISISCMGVQGMFQQTAVYYNQQLGPKTLFGAMLPGLATLSMGIPLSGTPATIPRSIALAYLGFGGQLLMPESYPMGFGTEKQRKEALRSSFDSALRIEESLGFINVRGAKGAQQKPTLTKRAIASAKEEFQARSLAVIVDFFSYVEDMYVSGAVINTPTHQEQGTVWGLMQENCNPIMNEMFISLLPERGTDDGVTVKRGRPDEWGQYPRLRPSLVIRERPFSWRNETYEMPGGLGGTTKFQVKFGDVFFSQRGKENRYSAEQEVASLTNPIAYAARAAKASVAKNTGSFSASTALLSSIRAVDRIKIKGSDIITHTLGLSDNDMFNFFMITQSKIPLTQVHQKFTLLLDGLIPIFLPESIKRYGLRLREMSTKFMFTGGGAVSSRKGLNFLIRCLMAYDLWHQHSAWYRAGSMSIRPCPMARPGMVLDVEWPGGTEESFYVEQVNHSFSHGANGEGQLATNLTLTRGQPSGFSDPKQIFPYAPPDPVNILNVNPETGIGVVIPRPPVLKQPQVLRSLLKSDAEKVEAYGQSVFAGFVEDEPPFETSSLYLEILAETPKDKQVLATAQKALRKLVGFGIDSSDVARVDSIYNQIAKPVLQDPSIPVKQDRQEAGRPPWAQAPLKGKMFSGAREFLMKVLDLMTGLFTSSK